MTRTAAVAVTCALLAGSPATTLAGDEGPLPYELTIEVVWGRPPGPESFRDSLAREVAAVIALRGCFEQVRRRRPEKPGPRDLLLEILVDGYEEELRFDSMVHQQAGPATDVNRRRTAELDAMFWLEIRTLDDALPVRRTRFRRQATWRPLHLEDPREVVLERVIENAARRTSGFACKGPAGKWLKQIERARADASR